MISKIIFLNSYLRFNNFTEYRFNLFNCLITIPQSNQICFSKSPIPKSFDLIKGIIKMNPSNYFSNNFSNNGLSINIVIRINQLNSTNFNCFLPRISNGVVSTETNTISISGTSYILTLTLTYKCISNNSNINWIITQSNINIIDQTKCHS